MRGFAVRYVVNDRQPLDDVADFDAFAAQMHADFRDAAWASWDRLLDQHVGLWYGGPRHACHDRAALARRLLAESDLSVAERSEPDAHELYAAYAGPLAWEYQFMTCDASRPEASSECACVPSNNLADWERQSGRRTCANGTDSGPSRTREVP